MLFIYATLGVVLGAIIGYLIRQSLASSKISSAESRAEKILEESKTHAKEIEIEAEAKALEVTEQAKKTELDFRNQIVRFEERIDRREKDLEIKSGNLDKKIEDLDAKKEALEKSQEEVKTLRATQLANLEKIAVMTKDEAATVLLNNAEKGIKEEMIGLHRKLINKAHEDAEKEARVIIAQAIERVATEVTSETTTTTVNIPSEEMKGRIIGKEGRNIRTFEQLMGVEIIIDDSPELCRYRGLIQFGLDESVHQAPTFPKSAWQSGGESN